MKRRLWHPLFLLAAVIFAAIGFAAPAAAQVGDVGTPVGLCVARVHPSQTPGHLFAGQVPIDCTTPQAAFGAGNYWVLSEPLTMRPGQVVRSASLWQDQMTLYARYADGHVAAIVTDGHAATRKLQLGAIFLDVPPARGVPVVQLLWHVEGAANLRGIVLGARIATADQSAASNLKMSAIYAAFGGLCLALIVYNLALWGALRHRFQLAYCGMVAALMLYAFSSSGALAWAWPEIANNDRLRVNYAALGMSAAAALVFGRCFFEPRVFAGWLGRLATGLCGALICVSLGFALLAPWRIGLLDLIYATTFLCLIAIVPLVVFRAARQQSNFLWIFAIAWAAPVLFAGLRVANTLNLIEWSFWIDNSTILAMTAEALLSSLAIAYRIRLLSIERDEAREQEIAARLLADTDPLTGLLNRRAFLRHAIGREGEQTLLIADLDHFKQVNETIGHDGGDEVLRCFARTLRQSVPPEALLARIGGEEFAILTPPAHAIEPDDVLARLRAARMPFDIAVTASIGACSGPIATDIDWKMLYRQADHALYEAKAAGRDRVRAARFPDRIAA